MINDFATNADRDKLFFRVVDGVLLVKKGQASQPEMVLKIDTLSRTYVTHNSAIGDAIRNNIPLLKPDAPSSDGKGSIKIVGSVFGHPDREDGETIETAGITTFHLSNNRSLDTRLGRLAKEKESGSLGKTLASALIGQVHGRKDYKL